MPHPRTRVKICGLTRPQDIATAASAGADAVGFVFYPQSSRLLGLEQARSLRAAVPAFVDVVALFVNAPRDEVQAVIDQVRPGLLQFHGDEPPEYCAGFHHPYMRAFRLGAPGLDTPQGVLAAAQQHGAAAAWLFDSYSPGYGGSGKTFDLSLLDAVRREPGSRPVVLAGGLNAATVAASIRDLRPYAVDVSSGVESAPGIKSAEKIKAFMRAVAQGDGAVVDKDAQTV
ncbi:phosphoribosylanthranilate isomerase [Candidimonas nitroreducens]|uniref:N-(5'-phosphoribosyl)anthranilate isomerase n=1 Tax=Candidimonas nitroreducens TaxID=683354 RepID=A0A225LZ78_9BURK|nr:phosphoribosylanthranilate isomerase [Candidimonas nitroreducens]OWT54477.1 N-(5'-phosphoribosyl)anthranilate isomerase [Candidimonas nitroreducens]